MDDFRIVLMILGALAVAALIIHGMWTIRKNNQDPNQIKDEPKGEKPEKKTAGLSSLKEKFEKAPVAETKERVEPNIDEGQLEMELPDDVFDETVIAEVEDDIAEPVVNETVASDSDGSEQNAGSGSEPEEVLILNVIAPEGQTISGAALLPFLLTLGFKYGEYSIFHRHEESSGSGAVLFSLANMFNPGTFDIDNMETFSTQGLSLFMSLPVKGEASQVFNMMHNAAKKIAAEFNGQVLDGQRSVLTRQTVQHYVERIREYERRQLLKA